MLQRNPLQIDQLFQEIEPATHVEDQVSRLRDRLDPETRAKLERLRRGQ